MPSHVFGLSVISRISDIVSNFNRQFLSKLFLWLFLLISFVFLFCTYPDFVFAQSAPVNCLGYSGWQGDISLRGASWHHRGTLVGVETEVSAGFLSPSGVWTAPDMISFGESGWEDANGTLYFDHSWNNPGGYTISILYRNCVFTRKVYVAASTEAVGNKVIDQWVKKYYLARPGHEFCGSLADYSMSVTDDGDSRTNNSFNYSMYLLGTDYNLYRGQPGGLAGVGWVPSFLKEGQGFSIRNYSINYKMASVSTDMVSWNAIPSSEGVRGYWALNNLRIFLDCRPDRTSPIGSVTISPSPIPTIPANTPTPHPTAIPQGNISISGYVRDFVSGKGIAGATVNVDKTDDKYGPCNGQHFGCGTVISNETGKWSIVCNNLAGVKSIFVKEVRNSTGYIDSSKYPDSAGGSVWDKNTVCHSNISGKTKIEPVNFYDSVLR